MGHSISPAPSLPTPISTRLKRTQFPSLGFQRVWACHQGCNEDQHDKLVRRRAVTLGLAGAMLSLNVGDQRASAAARRPPPPPPGERKDPNVSGVQAKVLASKKGRKL